VLSSPLNKKDRKPGQPRQPNPKPAAATTLPRFHWYYEWVYELSCLSIDGESTWLIAS
jgi:hypothetical protein